MGFFCFVQFAHSRLCENGLTQLSPLSALGQYDGVWTNRVLQGLLSNETLQTEQGEFLCWFRSAYTRQMFRSVLAHEGGICTFVHHMCNRIAA